MKKSPKTKAPETVELDTENKGRRAIAAVLFLILAAGSFAYGIYYLLRGESGWQEIRTLSTSGPTAASDFMLMYDVGSGGSSPKGENRSVTALYTQAAQEGYQLFTPDQTFEGVENIRSINENPNQVLTLSEPLYGALKLMEERGLRQLYLGPVYGAYESIGLSEDDVYAAELDPWKNGETGEYYGQIAAFASDPESVQVELLGGGKARLYVSDEYLAFAQENGISRFIDFGWMKNAFIADYIADTLTGAGYTRGVLSSYDGFSRTLGEVPCSVPLLKPVDGQLTGTGTLELTGPVSAVSLRTLPLGGSTALSFYVYGDGTVRTPYVCMDGKDRAAAESLTAYSGELSCGEILAELAPLFLADELDTAALEALDGIETVLP